MIEIKQLNKTFYLGGREVTALKDVDLTIRDGEIFGVIGYSGAGKSTLVRCINLLELPDSGSISVGSSGEIQLKNKKAYIDGHPMTERQLMKLRRSVGMIFQHFNLLDRSTVFENIAYPLRYQKMKRAEIEKRVMELLKLVDLTEKRDAYPAQLSGGQKQRVAIARALANNPRILLSDEATSALDPDATEAILSLLRRLNEQLGLTVVLITHEMAVIKAVCHRVAVMEEGAVVEEGTAYDIFAHPKQGITRRFVSSASAMGKLDVMLENQAEIVRLKPGQKLVRLTFRQDAVGDSIISKISREFGVDLNIVLANVDVLQGSPLGNLAAVIGGGEENVNGALNYLSAHHIEVEVIKDGTVH